ncbi:N-isopropylammelide isopropyl amidohydrolase [Paenibacillus konkukensis]|uniref:N-isopropylammelide isopropyl amidohydrolase n=1 Tax=Paenibacillus konkukensis TaxID=2020716 RepID=A0ABY4RMG0_9BACL|nr:amidohydrolase [Paenibacillus konkukensis]UQZ83358.1 N-isopropylammelide isopropyl amidohydrolase [Paenibacillus konkukensis]
MSSAFWLTNVLLETGYQVEQGVIAGTNTGCFHLLIRDGNIAQIAPSDTVITDGLPRKDARRRLALPSFVEKHCHLDKTMLGDRWRAVTPAANIFERFEIEKEVIPSLRTTMQERAERLLEIYLQAGVTHVRTHVDIFPEAGLNHLHAVRQALQTFEGKLTYEIVAFAQHGLLRTKAQSLVKEALREGASLVGGVDPAMVDGDIEASLQAMVELAVEGNAGIDLHLHDPDHLGVFTIKRLAWLTKEAGLQGKVAVSHAFGLGEISPSEAEAMGDILADAGVAVITSVPMGRMFPPVGLLRGKGVEVAVGCDNIFDVWSPFGNGDILERAGRLAQISKWVDERSLAQTLYFITGGKTPLDDEGNQVWPKVGDEASIVLVEASCSAEAVARRSKRAAALFKGTVVSGSIQSGTI